MGSRKGRVLVAMSGGVDSSVTAALLLEEGFEVIGATLQLQSCDEAAFGAGCGGAAGPAQAGLVSRMLGIPHHVFDCRQQFERAVLHYCWREYSRGRTPNPCIVCNERFKFGFLLEAASSLGASQIATGHYARIERPGQGGLQLKRGVDRNKDQSYFLFALNARQLEAALLPIGALSKAEVRAQAHRLGLPNAGRGESQDACLTADHVCYAEILRQRFHGEARAGEVVDNQGRVLGHHQGFHHFTIGQRKGLGIALGQRAWVTAIHPESARVVLCRDEGELFAQGLVASDVTWSPSVVLPLPISCSVQIRYRHQPVPAVVEPLGNGRVRVAFASAVRAVTPGQAAVFYDGNILLGGGWIEKSF